MVGDVISSVSEKTTVALIPARAGSKGLPGKNVRTLLDRPLIAHSFAVAQMIQSVGLVHVSSDDPRVVAASLEAGINVGSLRPQELSTDETPMSAVIRYEAERLLDEGLATYSDLLLLLDPTSPIRYPTEIQSALDCLLTTPEAHGIVSVSAPSFNPLWVGVQLSEDQRLIRHPQTLSGYVRRQDVPPYWRINGSFYAWRFRHALELPDNWIDTGFNLGWETSDVASHSIDTIDDFRLVEALLTSGIVHLPWLD